MSGQQGSYQPNANDWQTVYAPGTVGVRQHQRRVESVEEQLDDAVAGVGDDRAQLFAFLHVLAALPDVGRHSVDRAVAGSHHVPRLEALDPVVDVLQLPLDREQVLFRLPQVAAGHRDRRQAVGIRLDDERLLGEQRRLGPLDLGVRLVGVGAGPVGPHPRLVARQAALQAAESGIGEQVVEGLETVPLELQRELRIGLEIGRAHV